MVKINKYMCISSLVALAAIIAWWVWLIYRMKTPAHQPFENWPEEWQDYTVMTCHSNKPIADCICIARLMREYYSSVDKMNNATSDERKRDRENIKALCASSVA